MQYGEVRSEYDVIWEIANQRHNIKDWMLIELFPSIKTYLLIAVSADAVYNASQKHESTSLHTYVVLNEYF